MTQRKHVQQMIEFANNPNALAFVKLGDINGYDYFILVDYPLWEDDREYVVRDDMSLEEAQADRKGTIVEFGRQCIAQNAQIDLSQTALYETRV